MYANHLTNTYDHMIELKTNVNNAKTIIRSYQIITDEIYICHLLCQNHCVQQSPNHTDYSLTSSTVDLLLFCAKCNFIQIYNQLNHSIVYSYANLSRDMVRLHLNITNTVQQMSLNCINDRNEIQIIKANFRLINPHNSTRSFSCSINPMNVHPHHEEIILECDNFTTRADIILWAVIKQSECASVYVLNFICSFRT